MTKIRNANEKDFYASLKIAENLKKCFGKSCSRDMAIDFKVNHLTVAYKGEEVVGFACYSSWEGSIKVNWLGVKPKYQKNGVGGSLLNWLENKAKKLDSKAIWVETKEHDKAYKPALLFYYNHGFKKIYDFKATTKGWNDTILLEKRLG